MQATQIQKQPLLIAAPSTRRRFSAPGILAEFAQLFFITLTFTLFLVLTSAGIWYFWSLFQNDSYKLVSSFLILISVSNIGCKYALWYYTHYYS